MYEIYKIITPSGKIYYGQHFNKKYPLDDGYMGSGWLLKKSFEKYGKKNHKKINLCFIDNKKCADCLEKLYILLAKINNENIKNIADGGQGGLIVPYQPERVIHYNKTRIITQETKNKISKSLKGKKQSKETKIKRALKHKGMKRSEECKRKISKSNTGKIRTDEAKQKISKANKGKKRTEEFKKNNSEIMKQKLNGETFYNWTGKSHSEETKKKMSESAKNRKRKIA